MKKYIPFVALVVFCSSFTICDKMVEQPDKTWKLYIYPFCGDTTTYIVRDCRIKPAYKERDYVKQGAWKNHPTTYVYTEHLYLSGVEKQTSTFSYEKGAGKVITSYWTENKYGDKRSAYETNDRLSDYKTYTFGDSLYLTVDYYKNGAIKSYQAENRHAGQTTGVEWDSLYTYKWQGNYRDEGRIDTLQRLENDGTETLVIIQHTNEKKDGKWVKYDRKGSILQEKVYK